MEQVIEWYHPWANLAPTLTQYMDEQDEVLVCGCGNSEMSVDMYDDGEGLALFSHGADSCVHYLNSAEKRCAHLILETLENICGDCMGSETTAPAVFHHTRTGVPPHVRYIRSSAD